MDKETKSELRLKSDQISDSLHRIRRQLEFIKKGEFQTLDGKVRSEIILQESKKIQKVTESF